MPMVIGIVPVLQDDASAPDGSAALRPLRGHTLLRRAVGALTRSGVVDRVVVVVPVALHDAVEATLATLDPGPATVELLLLPDAAGPDPRPGVGVVDCVRVALRSAAADCTEVVVHDPLHPLAPSALVQLVVQTLREDDECAATLPLRQVTDTLKWVDGDDIIVQTADRDSYRMVYSPQAFRRDGLLAALDAVDPSARRATGADVLARIVQAHGGRLLAVPAPGEVFRVSGADDVLLAEAMLAVGADTDEEATRASRARSLR